MGATATQSPREAGIVAQAYRYLVSGLVLPIPPSTLIEAAWSGTMQEARRQGVAASPQLGTLGADAEQDLLLFQEAYGALLAAAPSQLDEARLDQAAATAMAESVDDCHTAYLTADQWKSVEDDLRGSDSLDSLPLTFQLEPPHLIESVVDGSNAAQQSVKPGDRIIAWDGTPLDQIPLSQRKFLSPGAAGSTVRLDLEEPDGTRRTVSLRRERVDRPVITTRLMGAVAYLRLRTFTTNLSSSLDPTVDSLLAQGARAFVLDLRGNLGGELNSDVHLLSRFIASGELTLTAKRNGREETIQADGSVLAGPPPLTVLVDGGSLSASELFASNIQQFQAGELVGTPTPGCLLGSTFRSLADGSAIQISTEGVRAGPRELVVNNVGVQPDVLVVPTAADLAAGRDPQLDRALADALRQVTP